MPDDIEQYLADIESVSEEVRERAILALARYNDVQCIFALKKAAREDENLRLRNLARKCLMELKKEITSVAPDLYLRHETSDRHLNLKKLKGYLSSPDSKIRLNAVRSTITYKEKRTLGILNAHLAEETDPVVKGAAIIALGILGRSEVIPNLSGLLKDEREPLVRKAIIEGLSYSRDVNAYPVILKVFVTDRDKIVEKACMKALNKLGRHNLMQLLERMVKSSRAWRRDVAVRALGRFNSAAVIPLLELAIKDDEETIRGLAQKSLARLARFGNPRAREVVDQLKLQLEGPSKELSEEGDLFEGSTTIGLDDHDPNTRLAAIQAFAASGDMSKFPLLKDRLPVETHDYVKAALVTALYRLGGRAAVPALKDCLKDPIDRVRANAVEALAKCGDEGNYPLFIQLLKDKDCRTRANAIVALKKCTYVDVVRYIEQMIETREERMVRSAIHAILEIASDKAVALLADLASHESPVIREKAEAGLELLKARGNAAAKKLSTRLHVEKRVQVRKEHKGRPRAEAEPAEAPEPEPDPVPGRMPEPEPEPPPPAPPPVAAVPPPASGSALPPVREGRVAPRPQPQPEAQPQRQAPPEPPQPPPEPEPVRVVAPPPPSRPPPPEPEPQRIAASPLMKSKEVKAPPPPKGEPARPGEGFKLPFDTSQGVFSKATLDSAFAWLNRLPAAWRVALIALGMVWGMVLLMLFIGFIRSED
ncbi:MAG: HEAT repeat domain-containing protein [Candidatus Riflebacteria bacterium]|nr:HEAT repeat domain-containing protein [Candidatus Riflebacteria bacterium]